MFDGNITGKVDSGTIIKPSRKSKNFIPKSYRYVTYSKCPNRIKDSRPYIDTTETICRYMFGCEKDVKPAVKPAVKLTRTQKRKLGLI